MSNSGSLFKNPTLLVWGGLLAAFFVANGAFIYLAQNSDPGLVVDNYYERGQDYEKNMLKRLSNEPDWRLQAVVPEQIQRGTSARFELQALTLDGAALGPERVTVFAYRPTNAKYDFSVPMRVLENGTFGADVVFPLPGNWDLLITVEKEGVEQSLAQRVQVAD